MRTTVKHGSTIAAVLAAVLLVLPLYMTQPALASALPELSHDAASACAPALGADTCCGDDGCCAPKEPLREEDECDGPCVQRGDSTPADVPVSPVRPALAGPVVLSDAPAPALPAAFPAAAPRATESPPDVLGASSRLRL